MCFSKKSWLIVAACVWIGLLSGCGSSNATPPANSAAAPVASLTATPASVTAGSSVTLAWTTTNASTVSINNGVGTVAASGSMTVSPSATTQYTLTATGSGGTVTSATTVTVQAAAAPTATLSASPTTITAGSSATLTWTTTGATTVSIDQGVGTVAASGSMKVSPSTTTQYTLTATGSGGTVTSVASVTVQPAAAPPTATLSASPTTITAGSSATLTWTTANATAVSINNGVGTVAVSGTVKVSPTATTQYTLTATGSGGTVTSVATVTVQGGAPTATLSASPTTITSGNSATLTWTTTNATAVSINNGIGTVAGSGSMNVSPTATTQYTLTATGSGGTATAVATVTVQSSAGTTATLSASLTTITAGNSAILSWTTANATAVSIDQGIGTVAASGSTTVSPSTTTQYTLTATGTGGSVTALTTVTVQPPVTPNSSISHLIILMMQNHSFDNLFGTYPGAAGLDPTLASYSQVDKAGNTISPTVVQTLDTGDPEHDLPSYVADWDNGKMDKFAYTEGDLAMQYYDNTVSGQATDGKSYGISTLWSYAQQYALADNFFASAMNSEPANELYMVAATIHNNHTSSALPPEAYDPCTAYQINSQGGVGTISVPLTETNVGDQLTGNSVPWTFYQTNYANSQNGTCLDYVPQEDPFQYFTSTQNSSHIQNFTMSSFKSVLSAGTLPAVVWITPDGAHDMHPGGGNILNGIEWIDEIVQAVQNSSEWQSSAIVVLYDEGGGWYDHVPPPQLSNTQGLGMRVPVTIVSPYAKSNYVSHQQMDFVSILRFIQWNWNLGEIPASAQGTREQQSGDLCDLLTSACGAPTP